MKFHSKKIVIIGGNTSLSSYIINNFINVGAEVLITLNKSGYNIFNNIPNITIAHLDLNSFSSIENFYIKYLLFFGPIDIIIFLTGILPGLNIFEYKDKNMLEISMINFIGQAALLNRMESVFSSESHVIFLSSISAERGSYDPLYSATKAAQIGLVKSLSRSLAPKIRVNAIAPGPIEDSTMLNNMTHVRRVAHLNQSPTGTLTTKEDIANIIVNICEPQWKNLNGQVIKLDGGSI